MRVLVVLVEVDYSGVGADIDPTPSGGHPSWPAQQLPTWVNNPIPTENLFDWEEPVGPASGLFTRYFQEASSGNFMVLGDYLEAPDGGIFHYSSSLGPNSPTQAINAVNLALGSNILTLHGLNSIGDYDKWTIGGSAGPGLPKVTPSTESPRKYDHVMFIWRNAGGNGSGYGSPGNSPGILLGFDANSYTNFGAFDRLPIQIMRHEFAHMVFGHNNFHYAGGGNGESGRYWISHSGGWGALGLSGSSLQTWSGWDRLQMDWKVPGQSNIIAARDETNTVEVNGDLDVAQPSQAGIYVLRDFVASGDAIRIKLPFTDPVLEYPEFLWVENHQGFNANGNPFDRFQFEDADCVVDAVPGLFMYVQIDRENRTAPSQSDLYAGYEEFLRPLNAGGAFEVTHAAIEYGNMCVGGEDDRPFTYGAANPFTGTSDTHITPVNLDGNDAITNFDMRLKRTEFEAGVYHDDLIWLGHPRQQFTPSGNFKLGIGTNPSSASMMNTLGYNIEVLC